MKSILFFVCVLFMTDVTWAQDSEVKTKKSRKTKTRSLLTKNYYDVSAQYIMWQELIDASGTGISGNGRFQFSGYQFGLNKNKPFSSIRWVQQYSTHLTVGTTKGTGESNTFTDEFKNQLWFSLSGSAGLIYRTTAASEIGLFVPLSFRMIQWELANNAAIELDKETSFSAGLGFQFVQRFTPRSSMVISVAHQIVWEATQWSIGYQLSLR